MLIVGEITHEQTENYCYAQIVLSYINIIGIGSRLENKCYSKTDASQAFQCQYITSHHNISNYFSSQSLAFLIVCWWHQQLPKCLKQKPWHDLQQFLSLSLHPISRQVLSVFPHKWISSSSFSSPLWEPYWFKVAISCQDSHKSLLPSFLVSISTSLHLIFQITVRVIFLGARLSKSKSIQFKFLPGLSYLYGLR